MKAGDKWKPRGGRPGGFEIIEVDAHAVTVEVSRVVLTKEKKRRLEKRRRVVLLNDFEVFSGGYEQVHDH
jgi:hypothetical protein